jgi:hypothetical protein
VKAKWTKNGKLGVILLAVAALAVATLPARALGVDEDGDGFSAQIEEENGATYCLGGCLDAKGAQVQTCGDEFIGDDRPDLFVTLDSITQTIKFVDHIQNGFLKDLKRRRGGKAIHVHDATGRVRECGINCLEDRQVFCPDILQKSINVTENTAGGDGAMGQCICERCTPNDWDFITIFPNRILDDIRENCTTNKTCEVNKSDPAIECGPGMINCDHPDGPLFQLYLTHVVAHEIGHNIMLADSMGDDGTYHKNASEKVVMSNRVFIRNRGNTAIWYFTGSWSSGSQDGFLLKQPY